MQPIPGKSLANDILAGLKAKIQDTGIRPKLGVLLVGDDPASHLYVKLKDKAAQDIGIRTDMRFLGEDATDWDIIKVIKDWNDDPTIHGILIQMPLPPGHDTDAIFGAIDPKKDADGFHPENVQALKEGKATVISPLHEGILRLIGATPVVPNHSLAIILCNSQTFADPLKYILERAGATVRVMLAEEKDDKKLREADIIVVAVGKLDFLNSNAVKPDTCVIDVGINKNPQGKTRGDFDSQACEDMTGWYSPVPGGVGPLTIALLLKNVVEFATQDQKSKV